MLTWLNPWQRKCREAMFTSSKLVHVFVKVNLLCFSVTDAMTHATQFPYNQDKVAKSNYISCR